MRRVLCLVAILVGSIPVQAQDPCTPTRINYFVGWLYNAAYAAGPAVPAGKIWELDRGGVASNDSAFRYVMFQVNESALWNNQTPVDCAVSPGSCYAFPAAGTAAVPPTPKAAIFPVTLTQGQRLSARTNDTLTDFALLYSGWEYPAECQVRRMFAAAQGSGAGGQTPDITALRTYLRQVLTAAASVP